MNLASALVGISIAGVAAPHIATMSLQPMIAQKTAANFSVAESAAVVFAAKYEGGEEEPKSTDNCSATDLTNRSWEVTCVEGEGRFKTEVTRAFRLRPADLGGYTNPTRSFAFETPPDFSHNQCLPGDEWGVIWYNEHLKAGHTDACIPQPAFSRQAYLDSDPGDWLFDLSNFGFGSHPDF